jgi:hypothetical protein
MRVIRRSLIVADSEGKATAVKELPSIPIKQGISDPLGPGLGDIDRFARCQKTRIGSGKDCDTVTRFGHEPKFDSFLVEEVANPKLDRFRFGRRIKILKSETTETEVTGIEVNIEEIHPEIHDELCIRVLFIDPAGV